MVLITGGNVSSLERCGSYLNENTDNFFPAINEKHYELSDTSVYKRLGVVLFAIERITFLMNEKKRP